METRITAIEYELGKLEPITTLPRTPVQQEAVDTMLATGLSTYSRSDAPVAHMGSACMARTLQRAGLGPDDIGAIVVATESLWDHGDTNTIERLSKRLLRQSFYEMSAKAGIHHAFPFLVSFSGCGNLVSALTLADGLIRQQGIENVLVVVTDRNPPDEPGTRIMLPGVAVVSDAAASCVMTSRAVDGYALGSVVLHANLGLWGLHLEDNFARAAIEVAKSLKVIGDMMVKRSGQSPAQYRYFLPNNYAPLMLKVFCHQLGYKREQLFLDNISRVSHTYSADALINLRDIEDKQRPAEGDQIMTLSSGPVSWGMMSLTARVESLPGPHDVRETKEAQ